MENKKIHVLKLSTEFVGDVLSGDKNFEIRFNDRGYQRGDLVQFKAFNKDHIVDSELDNIFYEITYVLNGWGLKEDYVVFGIRRYGRRYGMEV